MKTNLVHAVPRYFLAFTLAFSLCLPTAGLAYATPDEESTPPENTEVTQTQSTAPDDSSLSPCIPSEEDIAKWEADGTLDERIAFQESLGNGEVSSDLIAQALQRNSGPAKLRSSNGNNLPSDDKGRLSMNTVGNANVLALHVDFPNENGEGTIGFKSGDTVEALQALIGSPLPTSDASNSSQASNPNADFAPYDSLHAYYKRSSYGKLNISGTAVEYTAQYPRDYYYDDVDMLFAEAIESLDGQIDYTQYDANNDKLIDAVYLHFAGENSGWNTTWWSVCYSFNGTQPNNAEGLGIGRVVTLHEPSNTEVGVRTAIHETGHVLGLPDYYTYNEQFVEKDPSYRTGILTFDMMNNNIGDHNAYSKWLLGWIDNDDITRIVANDSGITVKIGSESAQKSESGSINATLELLANDTGTECGGFIAISNNDSLLEPLGLFSSFYLLEYNGFAGNQIVRYVTGYDATSEMTLSDEIPSGFRLFRVQGDLSPDKASFIHENRSDDVHDQFIELVDHDGSAMHLKYSNYADGTGLAPYECMMTAGDIITPTGSGTVNGGITANYPTTNFFENINRGFTGLSIEVVESESTHGTVLVSHSNEEEPDISPDSLTLALAKPRGVSNIDALELVGSVPLKRAQGSSLPYVKAKETCCTVTAIEEIRGSTIKLSYAMPPELFDSAETCELVFPEGFFLVGTKDGVDVYSSEIRVTLPVETAVTIEKAGDYSNAASDERILSNVVTTDVGTTYFAVSDEDLLKLHKVNSEDPSKVDVNVIEGLDSESIYSVKLVPMAEGKLCVITSEYLDMYGTMQTAHWVDPSTLSVEASYDIGGQSFDILCSSGESLLASWTYNISWEYTILMLAMFTPKSDGSFEESYWEVTDTGAILPVSNTDGELAFIGRPYSPYQSTIKIVDPAELSNSADEYGIINFESLNAKVTLDTTGFAEAEAFAYSEGRYLGVTCNVPEAAGSPDVSEAGTQASEEDNPVPAWRGSTDLKAYLVSFDEIGSVASSKLFGTFPMFGASIKSLNISPDNTPVIEVMLGEEYIEEGRRMFFFSNGINEDPVTLSNESSASGAWVSGNAWLEIGFNFPYSHFFPEGDNADGNDGALGSPELSGEGIGGGYENNSRPVHYLLTLLPTEDGNGGDTGGDGGNDGSEGPDPIPGNGNNSGNESTLSNTGDATGLIMGACAIAAIAAIAVAIIAFRASRKQRNR